MSAYICNPEHTAALAAFAVHSVDQYNHAIYEWRVESNPLKTARKVAEELMRENIRSVAAHYPSDTSGQRPGPCGYTDEALIQASGDLAEKYYFMGRRLQLIDILSMSSSYAYQSCETEDWKSSLAFRQIDWIQDAAIRQLPGFDKAIHDYDGSLHKEARRAG